MRKCLIFSALSLFLAINTHAQTEFRTSVDSSVARIGEQRLMQLKVVAPTGFTVLFPSFTDTITSQIEIVRSSAIDTMKLVDNTVFTQNLIITSFDTGYLVVPPLLITSISPSGDSLNIESEAFLFHVQGVDVDTTQAIKDIKPPLRVPYTLRELLPWIGIALTAILTVFLIVYLVRRYRKRKQYTAKESVPSEPAHIIALRELEKLKAEKLHEKGEVKLYYIQITDILRTYIENGLCIPAIEMTSAEIINAISELLNTRPGLIEEMDFLLQTADLVKFAKASPLPQVHDQCMKTAFSFIQFTIIPEPTNTGKDETASA